MLISAPLDKESASMSNDGICLKLYSRNQELIWFTMYAKNITKIEETTDTCNWAALEEHRLL